MDAPARLGAQAADLGLALSEPTCRQEVRFLQEVLHWNRRVNLTAIRNLEQGIEKHLLDSLAALPFFKGDEHLLDIGSGAGFPGIPLALALPGLKVTSVDSVAKKIQFQRHAVRLFALQERVQPLHARIEDLPEKCRAEPYDTVIARAFSSLSTILRCSAPLLAPGGRLLVMKGAEAQQELAENRDIIVESGFIQGRNVFFTLPDSHASRAVIVLHKLNLDP